MYNIQLFKWRKIKLKWIIERIESLKHCMKSEAVGVICSINHDFFIQCLYQLNSFFYDVRSIEKFTMFYASKINIFNWIKNIFNEIDFVELDLTLTIIHNSYNNTSYHLTFVIVVSLKINAFIQKLNNWASITSASQIDIFMKTNFSVWIISIYQFYAKQVNSKID